MAEWDDANLQGTQVLERRRGPAIAVHRQRLAAVEGPDAGRVFEARATHMVIGTSASSDVVLSDDAVSARHCEIAVRGDRYVLRDLDSTNGTWLSGVEVIEAFVAPGARITVGLTELTFEPLAEWIPIQEAPTSSFGDLVGDSPVMRRLFGVLERIAATDLTCTLVGATGTGKEVAARSLHAASGRAAHPFVVMDCGAVSASLIESELFGHERGAFTGADRAHRGAFEQANGGTLFLDEVGELPLELQPKLLRALERREVRRIGAETTTDVDIRVIAATHRNLEEMVEEGAFREDLYFRLAEVVVRVPALRDRPEDLPALARSLLSSLSVGGAGSIHLAEDAFHLLAQQPWPGNVRELRNLLRRACALASDDTIDAALLERAMSLGKPPQISAGDEASQVPVGDDGPIRRAREGWIATLEPVYIRRLLSRFEGDTEATAAHAGLHRKSLLRLLKHYGITAE